MKKSLLILSTLLTSFNLFAGSDPVSWSLNPSGFATTMVGNQSTVFYTLTNRLPLPVGISTYIETTGGRFHVHNECENAMLGTGRSCDITVAFMPETAGLSTFQLTYGYNNNRIPLPTLSAEGTAQPINAIKGSITGLPPTAYLGNTPDFNVFFVNTSASTLSNCSNPGPFMLSGPGSAGIVATTLRNTCGSTLAPQQSCELEGRLSNLNSVGKVIVTGNMVCSSPISVTSSPQAEMIVQNQEGCAIHGNTVLPLPSSTYKYADNVVKFEYENECPPGNAVQLGTVNIAANINATITKPALYDNCSNRVLDGGQDCTVIASVIPNQVSDNMIVTASVLAGANTATTNTNALVVTNQQSTHHVQFVNQCDFDVWYGIANGTGGGSSPDPNLATYPSGAPPSAYYLPKQIPGSRPSVIDLVVPQYTNGAIWPRTGCQMTNGQFVCTTGTCATMNNSATCNSTGNLIQPIPPYTKFEFFIQSSPGTDGVYDVSVINGFTVPVEIKAFGPTTGDPFNCTGSGALIQPQGSTLGACPWVFSPDSSLSGLERIDFQWVTPGAQASCTASDPNCGRAFNVAPPNNPSQIVQRSAPFLGYSTLANYFGYPSAGQWGAPNLYNKYGFATPLPASYGIPPTTYTWSVLFACTPTNNDSADSCYLDNAGSRCCGCVNWQDPGSPVSTASTKPCQNTNGDWTTNNPSSSVSGFNIEKGILWLKAACPTAYSYQFDDKSSSFQCNNDGATQLYTSYQITFCPGGVNGKPTAATEGRATPPP